MLRMNQPCDHLQTPFLPKKRADLTKTLCGPLCWWRYFLPYATCIPGLRIGEVRKKAQAHAHIFWRFDDANHRSHIKGLRSSKSFYFSENQFPPGIHSNMAWSQSENLDGEQDTGTVHVRGVRLNYLNHWMRLPSGNQPWQWRFVHL